MRERIQDDRRAEAHRSLQPGHRRRGPALLRRPGAHRPRHRAARGGRRGRADRADAAQPRRHPGGRRPRLRGRREDDLLPGRHGRLRGLQRGLRHVLRRAPRRPARRSRPPACRWTSSSRSRPSPSEAAPAAVTLRRVFDTPATAPLQSAHPMPEQPPSRPGRSDRPVSTERTPEPYRGRARRRPGHADALAPPQGPPPALRPAHARLRPRRRRGRHRHRARSSSSRRRPPRSRDVFADRADFALQAEPRGTADAVRAALAVAARHERRRSSSCPATCPSSTPA